MKKKSLLLLSGTLLAMVLSGCVTERTPGSSSKSSRSGSSGGGGASSSVTSDAGQEGGADEYEEIAFKGKLKIYYHNDTNDYANKRIWAWVDGVAGVEYMFDNQQTAASDPYGLHITFDLSQGLWADVVLTKFYFIIKEAGSWSGQSTDTLCPFGKFASNLDGDTETGTLSVYSCEGEGGNIDTFATKEEALGDRIATANFTDWRTLHIVGGGTQDGRAEDVIGKVDSYKLYAYDAAYLMMSREEQASNKYKYLVTESQTTVGQKDFNITLNKDVEPNLSYTLEAKMSQNTQRTKSKVASFTALFDTDKFERDYTYDGDDLGCTASIADKTATFKLWAPTASRVQVKIYSLGTPGDLYEVYQPTNNGGKRYEMQLTSHGVWERTITKLAMRNSSPLYYTYYVTNANGTNEVVDPYATAIGVSGKRGAIIDWNALETPEDWNKVASKTSANDNDHYLTDIVRPNELSIYEAHIRDLTMDETWNGQEIRGTYKAFIEEGTTYQGEKTGFDHIVEMGVKAVQLLPVFDHDNDERWLDEDGKYVTASKDYRDGKQVTPPAYNWGYNPQNYNCVEGSYCSDPTNAVTRINEFRELVAKFASKDIRVIMDVVYNHFASVNGHPLNKVVPGYFLRTTENGAAYDGTGCGNVTATERKMMRKFVVDSIKHWATNYKIKGFRFDLMGCMDVETMKQVKIACHRIDPDIVVYGEGWAGLGDGGFYACVNSKAKYANLRRASLSGIYAELQNIMDGTVNCGSVGGFSNGFRNAMKGDTANDVYPDWGFISKGANDVNNDMKRRVGEGFLGANIWGYQDNCWWKDETHNQGASEGFNNEQTVNYVTCHDNYGLFDQTQYAIKGQRVADVDDGNEDVLKAAVACESAALLNQGIAFIQGGDEIFRQKVMKPDNELYEELVESFHTETNGTNTWLVGDGIEQDSGNWLVRNAYKYGDEVNSFKWDRKVRYKEWYDQIKEAVHVRNQYMNNIFGRAYSEIARPSDVNNVFGSTYGYTDGAGTYHDTPNKQMIACYLAGKDGNHYYLCLGGRLDGQWVDLACGRQHIEVIYSSSKAHKPATPFDMESDNLGAGKFELMLCKVTPIA